MESETYPVLISENNSEDVLCSLEDVEFIVFTAYAGLYFFCPLRDSEEAALEKAIFLGRICIASLFLQRLYFQRSNACMGSRPQAF